VNALAVKFEEPFGNMELRFKNEITPHYADLKESYEVIKKIDELSEHVE